MKKLVWLVIPLFAGTALADLGVNQDLGTLAPGTIRLTGDTTGFPNNADRYDGIGMPTYTESGPEYVYQFTLTSPMQLSIPTRYQLGAPDNDQFILNSLMTTFDGTYQRAGGGIGFVDETGSFRAYGAGTYYLSVDGYNGAAGTYDFDLAAADYNVNPPSLQADLGAISDIGVDPDVVAYGDLSAAAIHWYEFSVGDIAAPYYLQIDTEGTQLTPTNDTEIALYDALGNFLVADDDSGSGNLSMMRLGDGQNHGALLGAGTYYLAIGGYNSTFANGFGATSTSSYIGAYTLNFSTNLSQPALGDMNCDGRVTFDDINAFVTALIGQAVYEAAYPNCQWLNGDIDHSGGVNFDDINPFVSCLVTGQCP